MRDRDPAQILIPVFAGEFQPERGVDAGRVVLLPAVKPGAKGRVRTGARAPARAVVEDEELRLVLGRDRSVPGRERAFHRVCPALGRGREDAALGAEEVEDEFLEGRLRQVFERRHQLPRLGIGVDRAEQLHRCAEAICGEDEAIRFAGLRFAEVDEAVDRRRQGGAVDRDRADLGDLGAFGFAFGPDRGLARPSRRPCRRPRSG